jgi:hypothetical protein
VATGVQRPLLRPLCRSCQPGARASGGSQPLRPAGSAASAPAPLHCEAGNRVERGFRGESRPRVLVLANHAKRFEPRDGCCIESAATRPRHRQDGERQPISGAQRRRRPDRQACVASIHAGERSWLQ